MNNKDTDKLKELLSSSKLKAGDNLKFRIMQQIQTEVALSGSQQRKKDARLSSQIKSLATLLGFIYASIGAALLAAYLLFGGDFLSSPELWMAVMFISVVTSVFGFIGYFDERLRFKNDLK